MPTYVTRLVNRLVAAVRPDGLSESPCPDAEAISDRQLRDMTLVQLADIPFERGPAPSDPVGPCRP